MNQFGNESGTGGGQARATEGEKRLSMLADNMSQMAYVATSDMHVEWVNKRWLDYTGMSVEEMNSSGWGRIVHPEDLPTIGDSFKEAVFKGERWEKEFRLRDKSGEYHWFLSISEPIKDESGRVLQWFGTNTDITRRKLAEKELALTAKNTDRFLATLAHELRNPLAPLRNGLHLLEMAPEDAVFQQETRAMMKRQLDHLVRLVDDLMDLSRISRGQVKLELEELDLQEVVATALEASASVMSEAGHHIRTEGTGESIHVQGDRHRLVQVVSHLLANAAKFTDSGGEVTLTLRSEGDHALLAITDTGIGIDPAALPEVFEMFAQVAAHDKKHGGKGLGIGLNLAKQIIGLHGGTIDGSSEGTGMGSEFKVRIPLLKRKRANQPVVVANSDATAEVRKRILVVDDNKDAVFSMGVMLEKLGHEVVTAHDGEEAVQKGAAFKPHLVLMDLGMPKLNGLEACAQMRQADWGKQANIVALSGWGQEEDRRISAEAGFDHHVVKPINRATLLHLVSS
ncbi:MAG: ATP-binding protein [Flavobacteriales bacterium]|jgi:PAS domain S-box-containing protein